LQARLAQLRQKYACAVKEATEQNIYLLLQDQHAWGEQEQQCLKAINEIQLSIQELAGKLAEIENLRNRLKSLQTEKKSLHESYQKLVSLKNLIPEPVDVRERALTATQMPKRTAKGAGFWLVASLLIGLMVAYLRQYMDTALTTEYDVRRHLNIPVLGLIPYVKEEVNLYHQPPKAPLTELFNTVSTLLLATLKEGNLRTLLVCSTNPKEGKSTVATNLSLSLARKGYKVALMDSDLRLPQLHSLLNMDNSRGLCTLLENTRRPGTENIQLTDYLQPTAEENLWLLPCGPPPTNPVKLLESEQIKRVLSQLKESFDYVIVDSPPICTVGDSLILARLVDACLLVVGSGLVEQRDASWAKHLLSNVQASIIGVILNMTKTTRGMEYYYYSEYRKYIRTRT
jgi:capsular exopolysaccharide synthesis family protein